MGLSELWKRGGGEGRGGEGRGGEGRGRGVLTSKSEKSMVVMVVVVCFGSTFSTFSPSLLLARMTSSAAPTPFTIDVPQSDLDDLRHRLDIARFPDQLEGVGWTYGTELTYLKELVEYWRTKFDWRKQEALLNRQGFLTFNSQNMCGEYLTIFVVASSSSSLR